MNTVLYGDVTLMQVTFFLGIVIASLIFSRLIISLIRRNFNDRLDQDQFQLINKLVFYGVVGSGTIAAIPPSRNQTVRAGGCRWGGRYGHRFCQSESGE